VLNILCKQVYFAIAAIQLSICKKNVYIVVVVVESNRHVDKYWTWKMVFDLKMWIIAWLLLEPCQILGKEEFENCWTFYKTNLKSSERYQNCKTFRYSFKYSNFELYGGYHKLLISIKGVVTNDKFSEGPNQRVHQSK
jgi:hypothetical protein